MTESTEGLSNLLHEDRRFPPSDGVRRRGQRPGRRLRAGRRRPAGVLGGPGPPAGLGQDGPQTLDWSNAPFAKWFVGGTLNASVNCVDRHVAAGRGDKVAIHFEGEPGDTRTVTYAELKDLVCQAANALTELGIGQGDRVAIYLPMSIEAVVSMLACARLGAIHSVIFGGFSAQAIYDRVLDADASLVITADGGYRRGKVLPAQADRGRGAGQGQDQRRHGAGGQARRQRDRLDRGPRRLVVRRGGPASPPSTSRRPSTASSRCSSSTPREPPVNRRESCTPPAAT